MMSSSKRPPVPGKEDILNNQGLNKMSYKNFGEEANSSKNKASFNETLIAASYNQADGSDGHEHGVSQESSNSSGGFAHLKWNENFAYLMDDMDGIKLFRKFLEDNNQAFLIDFRFACQGLKLKFEDNSKHTSSIVKSIYKKYIKGGFIQLKSSTKKTLVEALKANNIHEKIFDQAREDNDQILEKIYYPKFLASSLYKKYAEYELENSKLSSHSGSSERNISQNYIKKLMEPLNDQSTLSSISFISEDVPQTDSISQKPLADTKTDQLPKPLNSTFSNPHLHTSLVSSDLLSLTSDQLTDDAISFTSSSHDGQEHKTRGSFMRHMQHIQQSKPPSKHFLPRTQRVDANFIQASNIARNNPPLFAKILINKLNEVLNENASNADDGDMGDDLSDQYKYMDVPGGSKVCKRQFSSLSMASRLLQMLNKEVDKGLDQEALDVLDLQCSNIRETSPFEADYHKPSRYKDPYYSQQHYNPHHSRDTYSQSSRNHHGSIMDAYSRRKDGGSMVNVPLSHHKNHPVHSASSLHNSDHYHPLHHTDHHKVKHPLFHKPPMVSDRVPLYPSSQHRATKHKNHSEISDLLDDICNDKHRVESWVESTKGVYNRHKLSADASSDKASTFKKSSSHSHSEHSKRHSVRHKHAHSSNIDKRNDSSCQQRPSETQGIKDSIVVGYYFWDEPIPYRTTIPSSHPTLAQFKNILTRKGSFRYFFKHECSDFGGDVVHEEVLDDGQVLPLWQGKVFCKIEPVFSNL